MQSRNPINPIRKKLRTLTYAAAINEALHQAMEISSDVHVLGQLVDYKSGIFGTTTGLVEKFGRDRVHDFPIAESLMTATAIGAALTGLRPILVHQRLDFAFYSMDAIVNWLSLWRFKSNGQSGLPVTIRMIVGKGWGQGPQHSKSVHAWFAHLPGIKVAIPSTSHDVKGLLLESIFGDDPVIFIEHRSLFSMTDFVPEHPYRVSFGQAVIRRLGRDLTLVAIGVMVPMAMQAASYLSEEGIDIEVIDIRTLSPLDKDTIFNSIVKTKRLLVADPAWHSFGASSEIIASVTEKLGKQLKADPGRICFPDSHTPTSYVLENYYYPNKDNIINEIRRLVVM